MRQLIEIPFSRFEFKNVFQRGEFEVRTFFGNGCSLKGCLVIGNLGGKEGLQGGPPQSDYGFFPPPSFLIELGESSFEFKDFSRFFHDFFRKTVKKQVLSFSIKSTLFELKTHKKMAVAAGIEPTTCSLGESRSIQLSYATAFCLCRKNKWTGNRPFNSRFIRPFCVVCEQVYTILPF